MANTAPTNPFFYGGRIVDPPRFVGRTQEIRFIIQRMSGAQMTSVGVVGPPRIGKSSLLYHLYQTYPERVQASQWFLVSYVSLQDARVRNLAGFLQTVGNALATARRWHPKGSLLPAWPTPCRDLPTFRQGLQTMAEAGLRCVLCLDEFEALLDAPTEFDDHFFDALRAAMDDQVLMLIIASARPLSFYGSRVRSVSRFFNLGNTRYLEELSENEARELVRLPIDVGGSVPALGVGDQALALRLGGRHPYLLQMAAYTVFEAQVSGQDETWVRTQFEREAAGYRGVRVRVRQWLAHSLWTTPAAVGRLAGWLGARQDEARNWAVGMVIVLLVILAITGALPVREFLRWLMAVLGLGGGQP
ncbi:MAG: ATP-binding protein [Anaerolineae bacterium]|nr:ATP-binding protein [Anaerolineae bacterium]